MRVAPKIKTPPQGKYAERLRAKKGSTGLVSYRKTVDSAGQRSKAGDGDLGVLN